MQLYTPLHCRKRKSIGTAGLGEGGGGEGEGSGERDSVSGRVSRGILFLPLIHQGCIKFRTLRIKGFLWFFITFLKLCYKRLANILSGSNKS